MLGPIVIDFGPEVATSARQVALSACNEAVIDGECIAAGPPLPEEARALASANAEAGARSVRIEVTLVPSGQAPSLVRELEFAAADPERERWRSVGLAIATLVGEEQRRRQETAEAAKLAPTPPPSSTAPPSSPPPPSSPSPLEPISGVLFGIGALAAPALEDGSWRTGVMLRGAWVSPASWSLASELAYSQRSTGPDGYAASWLSLELGGGYRLTLTERWSVGLTLTAGVQRLAFELLVHGLSVSDSVYNPSLSLGADAWWLVLRGFGVWLALEAHTIGRKSELYFEGDRRVSTVPVEAVGALGIGWRIR